MLTTTVLVLLLFSGGVLNKKSSHTHKSHNKHDIINKESGQINELRSPATNLHISEDNDRNTNNSTRRSIWDAINNANISVENHVHSYTTKSDISKDTNSTRRNIWDAINNANISVENHVHSYTTKSDINKDANSARRDIWDLLKNANISVHNSVHSTTVRKSNFHHSKSHGKNDDIRLKETTLLKPMKVIEVTGQKRDEEPSHMVRGTLDDGPAPVSVRGKSPSDVAD